MANLDYEDEEGLEKKTILYEIICCSEWTENIDDSAPLSSASESALGLLSYVNPSVYLRGKTLSPSEAITWKRSLAQHWQFAATNDGKIVGILQESSIETRSSRDNFKTVLGNNTVIIDPYASFRCMTWSKDSSLLAVAFTNGLIVFYNVMAVQLFSIRRDGPILFEEQDLNTPTDDFDISNYLVGFFFVEERLSRTTYCSELVTVDRQARIHCYRQSSMDQVELHHDSSVLRQHYPKGTTTVTYSESHSVLIAAGFLSSSEMSSRLESSVKYGVTIWRLLRDVPYYRLVHKIDDNEVITTFPKSSQEMWKMAVALTRSKAGPGVDDPITSVSNSPNGAFIAGIHISGAISIWHVPSLRLQSFWPLITQLHYSNENPRFNNRWRQAFNRSRTRRIDSWRFHPFQITWWNNQVIIITRVNGCVTLCSVHHDFPDRNLLGDSPELFECPLNVSNRFDSKGFFFALESEYRLKDKNFERKVSTSHSTSNNDSQSAEDQQEELDDLEDEEGSIIKRFIKEILFWATDMERFRPPRKRSKSKKLSWKYSQRLFRLQSITPSELFMRKIEHEEYGEALDLAQVYKLDSDLVFQRQWKRNAVSIHTIRNYLAKIKKRNWVLQECLERVPETEEAARELLNFGLRGTGLPALVVVSEGRDKGQFILWTSEDLELTEEEYLQLIEPTNPEVVRLLQYRQKYLHYLDMLDTYESILLGGSSTNKVSSSVEVENGYNVKIYGDLRTKAPHESAIEMAKNSNLHGLRVMFKNHWIEIAPHCLTVLNSFPETLSPHEYRDFLPELTSDGKECFIWDEFIQTKSKDWCEILLAKVNNEPTTTTFDLTPEITCEWYETRIREIEDRSGMTNLALELGRLGLQRNIHSLKQLVQALEVVEVLVYDMQMLDTTLSRLEKMPNFDRLQLLMSKATNETIVPQFKQFAIPFLDQCEQIQPGTKLCLLNQYLTTISKNDLSTTCKIFEYLKNETGEVIEYHELMELAKNAIYACEDTKQNENIFKILGCLPDRSSSTSTKISDWDDDDEDDDIINIPNKKRLDKLHGLIDKLETHYNATQVLEKYGISTTVKWIRDLEDICKNSATAGFDKLNASNAFRSANNSLSESMDQGHGDISIDRDNEDEVSSLFVKICRLASRIHPPMKINEWKVLLYDILELHKQLFLEFPQEKCFEIYVNALLHSGRSEVISLAKDFFQKEENQNDVNPSPVFSTTFALYLYQIPFSQVVDMILNAAYIYFDSSFNYSDSDIALVKVALSLLPNCKDGRTGHMIDLIDIIKILVIDFEINILPQTVRHTKDKLGLLRRAMENIPKGYRKISQLLKMGVYLRIENPTSNEPKILGVPEIESIVLAMAGEAALNILDCKWAVQICQSIMVKGYSSPSSLWSLFTRLAKWGETEDEESEEFLKLSPLTPELRKAFITYALNICPNSEIQNVLMASYLIEIKALRKRLEELSPSENDPAPSSFKNASEESIVKNLLGKIKVDPVLETTSRWLSPLTDMVNHISPIPLSKVKKLPEESDATYSITDQFTNPAVELCRVLNRVWHLERLVLGTSDTDLPPDGDGWDEGDIEVDVEPDDIQEDHEVKPDIKENNVQSIESEIEFQASSKGAEEDTEQEIDKDDDEEYEDFL